MHESNIMMFQVLPDSRDFSVSINQKSKSTPRAVRLHGKKKIVLIFSVYLLIKEVTQ